LARLITSFFVPNLVQIAPALGLLSEHMKCIMYDFVQLLLILVFSPWSDR